MSAFRGPLEDLFRLTSIFRGRLHALNHRVGVRARRRGRRFLNVLVGGGTDRFGWGTLPLTGRKSEQKQNDDRETHSVTRAHIFPATVWESVFATDFALSSSNPYTRISNAEVPFLTTRPKPDRALVLKYT